MRDLLIVLYPSGCIASQDIVRSLGTGHHIASSVYLDIIDMRVRASCGDIIMMIIMVLLEKWEMSIKNPVQRTDDYYYQKTSLFITQYGSTGI